MHWNTVFRRQVWSGRAKCVSHRHMQQLRIRQVPGRDREGVVQALRGWALHRQRHGKGQMRGLRQRDIFRHDWVRYMYIVLRGDVRGRYGGKCVHSVCCRQSLVDEGGRISRRLRGLRGGYVRGRGRRIGLHSVYVGDLLHRRGRDT